MPAKFVVAKDVMRKAQPVVEADASIDDVLALFRRKRINVLPVMENDKFIGEIHKIDLLKIMVDPDDMESDELVEMHYRVDYAFFAKTAADLMTLHSVTVKINDPIKLVAAKMLENAVRSALVVDNKEVVGIISINKLIKHFLEAKK